MTICCSYNIDRDVPYRKGVITNHTDAIRSLKVGESFFIPCGSCDDAKSKAKRIKGSLKYLGYLYWYDNHGYEYSVVKENGLFGVRVWRLEYTPSVSEEWLPVFS